MGKWLIITLGVILLVVVVLIVGSTLIPRSNAVSAAAQVTLPNEYLITYEVATENGTLETVTLGKDSDGYVYANNGVEALLFAPSGSGYLEYKATIDGLFVQAGDTLYTASYVEDATQSVLAYAKKSNLRYSQSAKLADTRILAGRACDLYTIDMQLGVYAMSDVMAVDQQTGVCLVWAQSQSVNGYEIKSEGDFTCTLFQTENVVLPSRSKTLAN
ncbi:MAG: hypothetical protein PHY12_09970 [Eubacteriales bacterium]|nr:hypothetical protein [Eubacteriales bacterium]